VKGSSLCLAISKVRLYFNAQSVGLIEKEKREYVPMKRKPFTYNK
jgi:hypothetical protein